MTHKQISLPDEGEGDPTTTNHITRTSSRLRDQSAQVTPLASIRAWVTPGDYREAELVAYCSQGFTWVEDTQSSEGCQPCFCYPEVEQVSDSMWEAVAEGVLQALKMSIIMLICMALVYSLAVFAIESLGRRAKRRGEKN